MSDKSLCRIDGTIHTAIKAEGNYWDCPAFEAVRHLRQRVEEMEKTLRTVHKLASHPPVDGYILKVVTDALPHPAPQNKGGE